jgi:hypothetical protein
MEIGVKRVEKDGWQDRLAASEWTPAHQTRLRKGPKTTKALKRLSVNYVDRQSHAAERDDRRGNVVECEEAALEFLVSH